MVSRTASCTCGRLRIEVAGQPLNIGVCHCLACQRRTGSVFAALASFAAPYMVHGTASEYIRAGDQGARFKFRFCPVCGTNLFHTELYRAEDGTDVEEDASVGVAVGAFGDPGFPAPRLSIYDCRRHPWVQLPPGIKRYEKDPI
ncbi:MAG: GFA family protein [Dongiaceae bacterium]